MIAPELRLNAAVRTDVGRVRQVNEDSFIARPEIGLWAVADGMGGHENGQWASREIVERLAEVALGEDFDASTNAVADAVHAANGLINRELQAVGRTMGSTVVVLLIQGRTFAVLWAGDSRIYLLRDGALIQLTHDHTQVQEMVDNGLLTPEEAKNHPMVHVISRAVGVEPKLELDAVTDEAAVGDVFLLCSDGLYGLVDDDEIAKVMGAVAPAAACEQLVELCLSRGAPDNVTVVTVACEEVTRLTVASSEA